MKIKKWIASLLAVVLCLSLFVVPAAAYSRVDVSAKSTLSLSYNDSERSFALKGMKLRLYKVADMSSAVRFTVTSDFESAGVSLEDMDAAKWTALAGTLAAYVAADRADGTADITPAYEGAVDENGELIFSDLPVGLYLLEGDALTDSGYTYTPTPFMLTLPTLNTESDEWVFDVTAANKYSRTYNGGGVSYTSRNVMKVWKDSDDAEEQRPASVTVQLLENGAVYDTVTLSEANNWQHSWTRLIDGRNWQLVEIDVPEEYTVLVEQSGNTFVVTNTFDVNIPDEDPPLSEIPEEPIPGGGLPQTGTLWWAVPLLAVAGVMLVLLGLLDRRGKKQRDEA